jgi:predicted glycoside hydrolase/deacetylase ChbG (UPF0249 family)
MGRLIINGDDFGISTETNHAIVRAQRDGILTSVSLTVNGSTFEEAVALGKAHPNLSVGIHLVRIQGRPTLPPATFQTSSGRTEISETIWSRQEWRFSFFLRWRAKSRKGSRPKSLR